MHVKTSSNPIYNDLYNSLYKAFYDSFSTISYHKLSKKKGTIDMELYLQKIGPILENTAHIQKIN